MLDDIVAGIDLKEKCVMFIGDFAICIPTSQKLSRRCMFFLRLN